MAKKSRDLYGNTFTYTLIDQKQVYTNYTMVAGLAIAIALYDGAKLFFINSTGTSSGISIR